MSWYWPQLRTRDLMPRQIDEFQRQLVLSAFPGGSRIVAEAPCRPNYAQYGPSYTAYPMRMTVQTPHGTTLGCILKDDRFIEGLAREAALLPVLRDLGLMVPQILAGPVVHPEYPQGGHLLVIEELPGEPLPFVGADLDGMDCTCRLLPRAIRRLHELTDGVRASPAAAVLPNRTLLDELEEIVRQGGPWLSNATFVSAVQMLRPVLRQMDRPLVFTNGDYNVTNFLHEEDRLTGWLDFTHACFEDPHVGMGKFVVWAYDCGWASGGKAGLVERYLYDMNVPRSDYAPRLAVRCLRLLQTDFTVDGQEDARGRAFALERLGECLTMLTGGRR